MAATSSLTPSFFPPTSSSSSSSSPSTTLPPPSPNRRKPNSHTAIICKAANDSGRRSLTIGFGAFTISFSRKGFFGANAAVLEADDDVELLERVKKDRKKRLQRQEVINSSKKETGPTSHL